MDYNPILDTDSYKLSHFMLYPPDVTNVYSYAESRGGAYGSTTFFGLQPFVRRLAERPIEEWDIFEAEGFANKHGEPFNADGWLRILNEHQGYLPIRICAVPEGLTIPQRNVLCTVENTDPHVPWLTSYIETALLRQVWYGTTVATRINGMKRAIKRHFDDSSDDLSNLGFALLDFSSRGCSSYGANELGGAAYLAHFLGSDSVPAVRYVNHHYDSAMSGFSIPASEHSVTTSWGKDRSLERKLAYIERAPAGSIISDVIDTWDCFHEASQWVSLKEKLREKGQTIVLRPDSGEIEDVIPEIIKIAAEGFGVTTNKKGYGVINGAKVLWGDGIDEDTVTIPFEIATDMKISADSVLTGSGGGLMQKDINRDTCKFAFKASAISKDEGQSWIGIAKDPVTDPGKKSKMGRLKLVRTSDCPTDDPALNYHTEQEADWSAWPNLLRPIYENGALFNMEGIDTIRKRIDSQL